MDFKKCLLILGLVCIAAGQDDSGLFDRGYRTAYRLYEDCQIRNVGVSACLKKKAITFFDRLARIDNLPIAENLELIKAPGANIEPIRNVSELETTLGRTNGASRDDVLNDILLDRVSSLMNSFNLQIRLPKTSPTDLKRSMEEGRGKMKKMMQNMMMMGMAMKMFAMVPMAMGMLFLLAGKALIISKIALVLSMIIGLKKLLSQKQGGDSHGWQSGGGGGGGGWDRSLKDHNLDYETTEQTKEYAHNLAYGGSSKQQQRK